MKAMIIPGNRKTYITENWYLYVKNKLQEMGIEVVAKNMPDPELAREKIWLPFIEKEIGDGDDVILIGHSSGAIAIMRYLETHRVGLAVIVGGYHTDLGDDQEKKSGYFDRQWQWDKIKQNAGRIIQFNSIDDPYIPIKEARHISDKLSTEYHEFKDRGHFGTDKQVCKEFPELIAAIKGFLADKK
jgi:predicted alpha/beta hydrolase family esterase